MMERIGKIVLDDKYYPGEDFYCDGEVEDELLSIVKNCSPDEYRRIIEERAKWPVLYHLSSLRENIVDWIPMDKQAKVLEVGSGCGAITGKLAEKAGEVTCVDLSKKRSRINAYRHQECGNVTIHLGNFKDIEPFLPCDYDYICLIGVFEYGQSYMGTAHPYEDFLLMLHRHLKEGGRIIIAIENKLGLKYFAGCKEDHLGTFFSGIEDYAGGGGVRTFSRQGLERIFSACGMKDYSFYYPYPDYKFMTALFSDDRLPMPGELSDNNRNFDRDRMRLFDEKQAFDGIIKDGLFPVFANSFVVVVGEGFDLKYVKYSNDRSPEYAVRTELCMDASGRKTIKKHALSKQASAHIRNMETAYRDLTKRFEGGKIDINRCVADTEGTAAEFEYIRGITLEEIMDACLEQDNIEKFHMLFNEYLKRISYREEQPAADYDLIFSNIIITPAQEAEDAGRGSADRLTVEDIIKAKWTVIDYEWTFGKPMAAKEIAFRAVYCYLLENEKRNKLQWNTVLETLCITEKEAEELKEQEAQFQRFVTGKNQSMAQIRDLIGYAVMEPQKWVHKFDGSASEDSIQIYEDRGNGYREEDSYFVKDAYVGENTVRLELKTDEEVSLLRVDPAMDSCLVRIKALTFNKKALEPVKRYIVTNGKTLKDGSFVFATKDPNINIKLNRMDKGAENTVSIEMEVVRIPEEAAQDIAGAVKKIF